VQAERKPWKYPGEQEEERKSRKRQNTGRRGTTQQRPEKPQLQEAAHPPSTSALHRTPHQLAVPPRPAAVAPRAPAPTPTPAPAPTSTRPPGQPGAPFTLGQAPIPAAFNPHSLSVVLSMMGRGNPVAPSTALAGPGIPPAPAANPVLPQMPGPQMTPQGLVPGFAPAPLPPLPPHLQQWFLSRPPVPVPRGPPGAPGAQAAGPPVLQPPMGRAAVQPHPLGNPPPPGATDPSERRQQ
jgi:hypothetical protein